MDKPSPRKKKNPGGDVTVQSALLVTDDGSSSDGRLPLSEIAHNSGSSTDRLSVNKVLFVEDGMNNENFSPIPSLTKWSRSSSIDSIDDSSRPDISSCQCTMDSSYVSNISKTSFFETSTSIIGRLSVGWLDEPNIVAMFLTGQLEGAPSTTTTANGTILASDVLDSTTFVTDDATECPWPKLGSNETYLSGRDFLKLFNAPEFELKTSPLLNSDSLPFHYSCMCEGHENQLPKDNKEDNCCKRCSKKLSLDLLELKKKVVENAAAITEMLVKNSECLPNATKTNGTNSGRSLDSTNSDTVTERNISNVFSTTVISAQQLAEFKTAQQLEGTGDNATAKATETISQTNTCRSSYQTASTPSKASTNDGEFSFQTPSQTHINKNSKSTPNYNKEDNTIRFNPFDSCAETLQMPTVSPSLFKDVMSPSQVEETNFRWSIEQMAVLNPASIEISSAGFETPQDPEYERKAQEAIDTFFSRRCILPSPWTNSLPQNKLNKDTALSKYSLPTNPSMTPVSSSGNKIKMFSGPAKCNKVKETRAVSTTTSVSCQTSLTLPPILPRHVEEVLAPYFKTDMSGNGHTTKHQDYNSLSNTSLCRRLLFGNEESSTDTPPNKLIFGSLNKPSIKTCISKLNNKKYAYPDSPAWISPQQLTQCSSVVSTRSPSDNYSPFSGIHSQLSVRANSDNKGCSESAFTPGSCKMDLPTCSPITFDAVGKKSPSPMGKATVCDSNNFLADSPTLPPSHHARHECFDLGMSWSSVVDNKLKSTALHPLSDHKDSSVLPEQLDLSPITSCSPNDLNTSAEETKRLDNSVRDARLCSVKSTPQSEAAAHTSVCSTLTGPSSSLLSICTVVEAGYHNASQRSQNNLTANLTSNKCEVSDSYDTSPDLSNTQITVSQRVEDKCLKCTCSKVNKCEEQNFSTKSNCCQVSAKEIQNGNNGKDSSSICHSSRKYHPDEYSSRESSCKTPSKAHKTKYQRLSGETSETKSTNSHLTPKPAQFSSSPIRASNCRSNDDEVTSTSNSSSMFASPPLSPILGRSGQISRDSLMPGAAEQCNNSNAATSDVLNKVTQALQDMLPEDLQKGYLKTVQDTLNVGDVERKDIEYSAENQDENSSELISNVENCRVSHVKNTSILESSKISSPALPSPEVLRMPDQFTNEDEAESGRRGILEHNSLNVTAASECWGSVKCCCSDGSRRDAKVGVTGRGCCKMSTHGGVMCPSNSLMWGEGDYESEDDSSMRSLQQLSQPSSYTADPTLHLYSCSVMDVDADPIISEGLSSENSCSQDTGYQTASLHTTNMCDFSHNTLSQSSQHSTVPAQHQSSSQNKGVAAAVTSESSCTHVDGSLRNPVDAPRDSAIAGGEVSFGVNDAPTYEFKLFGNNHISDSK